MKDISLVRINRPSRVVEHHWRNFIECLLEAGVDPDKNQIDTLILWEGYKLGYEKGLDEEGCGTEFYNRILKCIDCDTEIDEEKGERAEVCYDDTVHQKQFYPLCKNCLKSRMDILKKNKYA